MAEEQNQEDSLKELKPQISRLLIGNYENRIEHSYENGRSCRFLHKMKTPRQNPRLITSCVNE